MLEGGADGCEGLAEFGKRLLPDGLFGLGPTATPELLGLLPMLLPVVVPDETPGEPPAAPPVDMPPADEPAPVWAKAAVDEIARARPSMAVVSFMERSSIA
jgi:hypothetical protein